MRFNELKLHLIIILLITLVLFSVNVSIAAAASISGTIFQSDGTTPLTWAGIRIDVFSGDPCNENGLFSAYYNNSDGTYIIEGLGADTYSLRTYSPGANYTNEWWASPASASDCSTAGSIKVTAEETVTGINFQLDPGTTTISGTIFQSDGITPLTGAEIYIEVISGDPCSQYQYITHGFHNTLDGTYTVEGLTAGTYYLHTHIKEGNYINEWWASPASVSDCSAAGPITVTDEETVTGKNFQLDNGATISGTVFQSDGITPVTDDGITIICFTDDACSGKSIKYAYLKSSDGTFILEGLAPGSYYLRSISYNNYLDEWWASPLSVRDCSAAESITVSAVEAITEKNFQLDPGASISGTIYQSDGITPLTGVNFPIVIGSRENPCDIYLDRYASFDSFTGSYTFGGLLPGTYYVRTSVGGDGGMFFEGIDYLYDEWWASPASVRDCNDAKSIVITGTEAISGIDFQLDYVGDPGDVNFDQTVDLTDVILSLQTVAGITPSSPIFFEADVNGDYKIGIEEAIYVLKKVAGLAETVESFDSITLADIILINMSSDSINGSDNQDNQIPVGTVLVYQTNENRYGKMKILSYGYSLTVKWVTYNSDGSVFNCGNNLPIQGTCLYDMDNGTQETYQSSSSDFWWEQVDSTIRYIVPTNSARFSIFE